MIASTCASRPDRVGFLTVVSVLAAVVVAPTLTPAPAQAHAELASAGPAAGEVVREPLHAVRLTLTSPAREGLTRVTVRDPRGRDVTAGPPAVLDDQVTAVLTPLTLPGRYVVTYDLVASDGHVVAGSHAFRLARQAVTAGPTEVAATATGPRPRSSRGPTLGGLGAVTAIVVSAVVRRRSRRRPA